MLITRLSDKGVFARTIQQVRGYASLNLVQNYIGCDERKIKEVIDLLIFNQLAYQDIYKATFVRTLRVRACLVVT